MHLGDIMLSEIMTDIAWFHLHEVHRVVKSIETESRIVVTRVKMQEECLMSREFQLGNDENFLEMDTDDYYTAMWMYLSY